MYKSPTERNNEQEYLWSTESRKAFDNAIVFTLADLTINKENEYLETNYPNIVRKIQFI